MAGAGVVVVVVVVVWVAPQYLLILKIFLIFSLIKKKCFIMLF